VPALVIYAAIGSSRSLSLGPEATTALMTATAIGPLAGGNPARYAALAATLALLAGVMAAAAGTSRLGFLADLLSRPVLVGYMAGVALIMIAGQLGPATGVAVRGEAFAGRARRRCRPGLADRLADLRDLLRQRRESPVSRTRVEKVMGQR